MEISSLTALSPIDGRYRSQTAALANYFSEYGLIRYRVAVELEYFYFLARQKFFPLPAAAKKKLQAGMDQFGTAEALQIKEIERVTNHDVKAVEYFLKEQLDKAGIGHLKEWIHFGLTSQDINNTAIPLSWKHCLEETYLPAV
jgi:adenylosuccinate lyase